MIMYELFLHGKQGDDLNFYLEKSSNIIEGMRNWAIHFERARSVCEDVSAALVGKNVTIEADVHSIVFCPQDKEAEKVLKALVKRELLTANKI